jgi:hypothetical protein
MKTKLNILLILITFSVTTKSFAQWSYTKVDNGFDDMYKIAYTKINNNAMLKLENVDGIIYFYILGTYYCDEEILVELSFTVNNTFHKHAIFGVKSSDNKSVFLVADLLNSDMLLDFKNATNLKLRINDSCETVILNFNMANSSKALSFMLD